MAAPAPKGDSGTPTGGIAGGLLAILGVLVLANAGNGPQEKRATAASVQNVGSDYAGGTSVRTKAAPAFADKRAGAAMIAAEKLIKVPAYWLYHTWMTESGGLADAGWRDSWKRAKESYETGGCVASRTGTGANPDYAARACENDYALLQKICDRKDAQGKQLCDITTVRASPTFALGPMQIQPSNLVEDNGNWKRIAIDFDGDGVFNPFDLEDAIGASAMFAHRIQVHGKYGTDYAGWEKVSHRYYGATTDKRSELMAKHTKDWCDNNNCVLDNGALAQM